MFTKPLANRLRDRSAGERWVQRMGTLPSARASAGSGSEDHCAMTWRRGQPPQICDSECRVFAPRGSKCATDNTVCDASRSFAVDHGTYGACHNQRWDNFTIEFRSYCSGIALYRSLFPTQHPMKANPAKAGTTKPRVLPGAAPFSAEGVAYLWRESRAISMLTRSPRCRCQAFGGLGMLKVGGGCGWCGALTQSGAEVGGLEDVRWSLGYN